MRGIIQIILAFVFAPIFPLIAQNCSLKLNFPISTTHAYERLRQHNLESHAHIICLQDIFSHSKKSRARKF